MRHFKTPTLSDRPRGFTLIELMVVIALVAILLTIAAPALQTEIQKNRIASQVSTFLTDLKFARSEAMKMGAFVSMCPSSDGATCLGTAAWQSGWIVFSDVASTGAVASGDAVIRVRGGWATGDSFTPSTGLVSLTFNRLGFASNLGGSTSLLVARASTASSATTQCVSLNPVGLPTLQMAGTGLCN